MNGPTMRSKLFWLVSSLILLFRFLYVDLLLYLNEQLDIPLIEVAAAILSNLPLLILVIISVFYVVPLLTKKTNARQHPLLFFSCEIAYLLIVSALASLYIVSINAITSNRLQLQWLFYLSVIIFLINLFVAAFINIQFYNKIVQQKELEEEKRKTFRAIHDYNRLKRQLNPHFLFNCLNVLNSLVRSNPERAAAFIQKLAKVYRYLLNQEEERTVSFFDEMSFATSYFDLMRERFCEGLELLINVPDSVMRTHTIPCSVQIQIENAVKHNVIDPASPLIIEIFVDNKFVTVRNNLMPKLQSVESTGIGLASIETQYKMVFNHNVIKEVTDSYFIVKLPIIINS